MTMDSPHDGQSISLPAPELSTANSWSHFGQVKITSIRGLSKAMLVAHCKADLRRLPLGIQYKLLQRGGWLCRTTE